MQSVEKFFYCPPKICFLVGGQTMQNRFFGGQVSSPLKHLRSLVQLKFKMYFLAKCHNNNCSQFAAYIGLLNARFGSARVNIEQKRLTMNLENKLFQKKNYFSIPYFEVFFL